MSRIMKIAAVVLVLVIAQAALAQPAPKPPLADRLPAESIVYLGWGGIEPNKEALKQTGIGRVITDPEVLPHLESMWNQLEAFLKKQAEGKLPPGTYDAIRSLVLNVVVDRPWAISVMEVKLPGPDNPAVAVNAALLADLGDGADKAMANIDTLLKAFMPAEVQASIVEADVAGAKMKVLALGEGAPELIWGLTNKHLVVAIGRQAAEGIVGLVSGKGGQTLLANNPQFAKIIGKTGGGLVSFYADFARFRKELLPMILAMAVRDEEKVAQINKIIEAVGGEAIDAYGESTRIDGKEFVGQGYLLTPRGRPGALVLLDQKPLNSEMLTAVPNDATFAFAFNLNRVRVLDELEKQLAKFPEAKAEFEKFRAKLETETGLNLKADLAEAFGDGVAIYNSPAAGGFLITGLTILAEVKDAAKVRNSLAKIEQAIIKHLSEPPSPEMMDWPGQKAAFKPAKFKDYEYRYLVTNGLPWPFAISWCVTDKYLVISTFPQTMKAALLKIEAGRDGSLLGNDWVAKQLAGPAKNASAVGYVNDRQVIRIVYPLLLPAWQVACSLAAKADIKLDVNAMPRQDVLLANMGDSLSACVPDNEGVFLYGRSSGGAGGALMLAGGAAAAIALPALGEGMAAGKRAQSAANLNGLAKVIMIYRQQNNDQYPPNLETLVEQKLASPELLHAPQDQSGKVSYIYIKPAGEVINNTKVIIAYERPEINNFKGANVLFHDGHVKWHGMAELEKLLDEQKDLRQPRPRADADTSAGQAGRSL